MIVAHISFPDGRCVVEHREIPDPPQRPRVCEEERGYMSGYFTKPAMHHTGIHWCGYCGTEVEGGEGECPGCRSFIEFPVAGYEDFTAGF